MNSTLTPLGKIKPNPELEVKINGQVWKLELTKTKTTMIGLGKKLPKQLKH